MVLLEMSITPLGKGESVSAYVAECVDLVDRSGLPYELHAMGTIVEGELDQVLDLMQRVTLIPTVRRTLFGPRITLFLKDGRSITREGTGREFIWDFEEEARRIRGISPGTAIGDTQFAALIDSCRNLDTLDRAATRLIGLTLP